MDPMLQKINSEFIALDNSEIKRNNEILKSYVDAIVFYMKEEDPLFKKMFTNIFYGGSYYDGLKVGHPEEFDLNLLLSLPESASPFIATSNSPGFVKLQLKQYNQFARSAEASQYQNLDQLLDDYNFLDSQKVRFWMESAVQRALNHLRKKTHPDEVAVRAVKTGPAMTLLIEGKEIFENKKRDVKISIDLVPSFNFGMDKWKFLKGFRSNPVPDKPEFFLIPKSPKFIAKDANTSRFWRLSFYDQERELMGDKDNLKPTIRLLKKLRDRMMWESVIPSYYIKTILLWKCQAVGKDYWKQPLSLSFVDGLKKFQECVERKKIPYYFNEKNNLLEFTDERSLLVISNTLKSIIADIKNNPDNPMVVAKYLLTPQELIILGIKIHQNYIPETIPIFRNLAI